jgi:hypothetical protein
MLTMLRLSGCRAQSTLRKVYLIVALTESVGTNVRVVGEVKASHPSWRRNRWCLLLNFPLGSSPPSVDL